jgi:hypothetical protein
LTYGSRIVAMSTPVSFRFPTEAPRASLHLCAVVV